MIIDLVSPERRTEEALQGQGRVLRCVRGNQENRSRNWRTEFFLCGFERQVRRISNRKIFSRSNTERNDEQERDASATKVAEEVGGVDVPEEFESNYLPEPNRISVI